MDKQVYELKIDEELRTVAPPLTENETIILHQDIVEHGCKMPLLVWDGTVVDGHNRYRICHEKGIPFGIEEITFPDKTAAKLWIVKNQLGRRNLNDYQRCEMVYPMREPLMEEAERLRRERISTFRQTLPKSAASQSPDAL